MRALAAIGLLLAILADGSNPCNAMATPLDKEVQKNGYQPIDPPSTAGQPGSLYVKLKSTSGDVVPMPVCDLFPAPKIAGATDENAPIETASEVWQSVDQTKTSGFGLLFSLTKAIKAVTGLEMGGGWHNVTQTTIEWGPITSKTLVMRDLKQASRASQGSGTYVGKFDADCFQQARDLLAQKQSAFVIGRLAQAGSLKAKVVLNPTANPSASAEKASKPDSNGAKPQADKASAKPDDTSKPADASKRASDPKAALQAAAIKVATAGGDAAAAKLAGTGKKDSTAVPSASATNKPAASSAPNSNACGSGDAGTSGSFSIDLMKVLSIKSSACVKQTADDELTFQTPFNVGYVLLSLTDLKKAGLMTAPQSELTFRAATPEDLTSPNGAVSASQYTKLRQSFRN